MKISFTILLFFMMQFSFAQNQVDTGKIYVWVEQQPYVYFPGCDSTLERIPLIKCQHEKLKRFIDSNLKSPNPAVEAIVGVSFIVEKDGQLSNFEVDRASAPDFGEEAMRVLKLLPNWIPGKQNGQTVRTKFTMPLTFKLS